ncbi:MAG: response regulator transcription factor [Alphaproteobacteria bacterium]|nr:response regulator transcription factor [Alphaproteobacteria bacterium]
MTSVSTSADDASVHIAQENTRLPTAGQTDNPPTSPSSGQEPNLGAPITVLLIDPRPLIRSSLSAFLQTAQQLQVLALASADELTDEGSTSVESIDLVLLNLGASKTTSAQARSDIQFLSDRLPTTPVVVMSDCEDVSRIFATLRQGLRGYIPTTLSPAVTIEAIRLVAAGGTFIPPNVLMDSTDGWHTIRPTTVVGPSGGQLVNSLTSRQMEVLELVRKGKSNKLIGKELNMQESTVKVHIRQIMKKLKANNRTEAAFLAGQILGDSALGRNFGDLPLPSPRPDAALEPADRERTVWRRVVRPNEGLQLPIDAKNRPHG